MTDPDQGVLVDGKYRLGRVVRRSANAVVYRAEHVDIQREVEVKTLPFGIKSGAGVSDRLAREARAAGVVAHRNVQSVVDSGTDESGRPFIVFEPLAGRSLAEILSENPRGLPVDEAAPLIIQLLEGLAAVHAGGVIHAAINPENVVVVPLGHGEPLIKLTGFDEAVLPSGGDAKQLGTPPLSDYVAPERYRGGPLTPGVDVYAAGVLLRALMTGSAKRGRPLSDHAQRAVERATAPLPEERFPDARLLLEAVALLLRPEAEAEQTRDPSVHPATPDALEADLRYLKLRRDTSHGERKPVGEGRVNLVLALLLIESVYKTLGTKGWNQVVDRVPEVEQLLPGAGKTEVHRKLGIAVSLISDFLAAADAVAGRGDLGYVAGVGEAVAGKAIARLFPKGPRFTTPSRLISGFPQFWEAVTRQGRAKVLEHEPKSALLAVRSQVEPSLELSALVAGLLRGVLRDNAGSGQTEAEVQITACEALGDAATIFRLGW